MDTQRYDEQQQGWSPRCGWSIVGVFLAMVLLGTPTAFAQQSLENLQLNSTFDSSGPPFSQERQQALENPQPNSAHSGIDTLFGWVCNATSVQLLFDGFRRLNAVYGSPRTDTQATCGDANNGFVALVNWNDLGPGTHTVALCIDNVCGAPVTVFVSTYGTSFLQGRSSTFSVCTNRTNVANPPFPAATVLTWQESLQNFTILFTATCAQVAEICRDPRFAEACDLLSVCCQ